MEAGFCALDAVVFVRIIKGSELFAGVDEGFFELHGILEVHVVIAGAVDEEEVSFEIGSVGKR